MIIKLNVLISAVGEEVAVTVWSDCIKEIPYLNLYTGCGCCLTTALMSYKDNLPPYFIIDDETIIYSKDISFKLNRPFMTDDTGKPKYFAIC